MQEGMIQIGEAVLKGGDFVSSLVKEINIIDKKNKPLHIFKYNFNTKDKKLIIDTTEEATSESALKYLYIGSAPGAASRQWYATTSNYLYHLTETIANLASMNFKDSLKKKLETIKENFYVDLGEEFNNPKNRYILNFSALGIENCDVKGILEEVKSQLKTDSVDKPLREELKKRYTKIFESYLKEKFQLKKEGFALYTILIDDEPLCNFEEYRGAIKSEKEGGKSKNKSTKKVERNRCCSCCGSREDLTDEIQTEIKFYIKDKITFASDFDKNNFSKNMLMCQNCLKSILAAEKYIMNYLNTKIAGFTLYIVPHFVIGESLEIKELDFCSKKVVKSFNTVTNYKSLVDLRDEIDNRLEFADKQSYFLLNFIFYKKIQKATKVQKFIKDINPSIFKEIAEAEYETVNCSLRIFGENFNRRITLHKVYYLTPIRLIEGQAVQYKSLLNIYENIFLKRQMKKVNIIDGAIKSCRIINYEEVGYNVSKSEIHNIIMDANLFIKFLENLGCLKVGETMDTSTLMVDDKIKKYIEEMNYSEEETALFLLGYLIGEIGNSQRKRSSEGKKPILNKLNYAGIDKSKLTRLVTEVFGKLNQEKIRAYNEINFNECKRLIDKNFKQWSLNKQQNLFYILSGYGYETTKVMLGKKNGGNDDEQ